MKNILAPIVEAVLGFNDHEIFCNSLYNSDDYTFLALSLILMPFAVFLVFYKLIDPILSKRSHWISAVAITAVLMTIISYLTIMNGSMEICYASPENCNMLDMPIGENFITSLIMGALSLVPSIVFTMGLKYFSTNNKTNPF